MSSFTKSRVLLTLISKSNFPVGGFVVTNIQQAKTPRGVWGTNVVYMSLWTAVSQATPHHTNLASSSSVREKRYLQSSLMTNSLPNFLKNRFSLGFAVLVTIFHQPLSTTWLSGRYFLLACLSPRSHLCVFHVNKKINNGLSLHMCPMAFYKPVLTNWPIFMTTAAHCFLIFWWWWRTQ